MRLKIDAEIYISDLVDGFVSSKSSEIAYFIEGVSKGKNLSKGKLRKWMFRIFHYLSEEFLRNLQDNLNEHMKKSCDLDRGEGMSKTPRPSNFSKEDIQKVAEELRNRLDFKKYSDLEDFISNIGGEIEYSDLSDDSDTLIVEGLNKFKIQLPCNNSRNENSFNLARKLAHYFLHSELGKKQIIVNNNNLSNRVEWEANWFASAFLMPSEEINLLYKEKSIKDLSVHFKVSLEAMKIRLKDLKISIKD